MVYSRHIGGKPCKDITMLNQKCKDTCLHCTNIALPLTTRELFVLEPQLLGYLILCTSVVSKLVQHSPLNKRIASKSSYSNNEVNHIHSRAKGVSHCLQEYDCSFKFY
ncbi:hypothetical protein HPP92_022515 [Vanilla planifolia]|uniref:Uncharacterized protein n=1 Tax=Vanilla planifolia TaxID=51239 RepID=A0A835UDL8_VANPL|nr:hypothetical protein HPP92_022515 [Vanilla planifolia]